MKVSVVIPVYNAGQFIERAVKSALAERQTAEVIVIEDGSTDESLVVCKRLADSNERVRLFTHGNGENKGAAASRNLGMKQATQEFIAFLDADDFFLPGRFDCAEEVFARFRDCDGVYGAVGIEFLNDDSKAQWLASPMQNVKVTTMTREILPRDLFPALLNGRYGRIHIDGLIFRKRLLERSGLMNEKLVSMHEDTDFILRLAIAGRLYPGQLSFPVAVRWVHGGNRISAKRTVREQYNTRLKMHMEIYRWCKRNGYKQEKLLFIQRMAADCLYSTYQIGKIECATQIKIRRMVSWGLNNPEILLEKAYWKELIGLVIRSFKNNKDQ
jgi:glycosyltransferase involved in cell wall biosynthesis